LTDAPVKDRTRQLYIPLAWALLALFFGWLGLQPVTQLAADPAIQDPYYVVAHRQYALTLTATLLLFAIAHLGLGRIRRAPYRVWVAALHLALMTLGVSLMLSPQFALRPGHMPDRMDAMTKAFAFWNNVMAAGYALTLLGLLTFVGLVMLMVLDRRRA
jgi:heme/copper-type cytochrome/quinol oxidase subunit 1